MEPGPLIPPQPPQQPRVLRTAPEVLTWVIMQDAMGGCYQDPVSVPRDVIPWISQTMYRRRNRGLN